MLSWEVRGVRTVYSGGCTFLWLPCFKQNILQLYQRHETYAGFKTVGKENISCFILHVKLVTLAVILAMPTFYTRHKFVFFIILTYFS